MEIFSTSLKDKELSQMSAISSEVKYQIKRVIRYPKRYPKKETSSVMSWFLVTSARFKLATS
tara:strand:+ start:17 stop:202 length:186 start_codon:yes stop_codon:yes gene_type:complete